ncbi:MAG: hypothetical protein IKW84_08945 [Bacteroidaceae bacterium]|nr:hypothetical protein [Bacteroidaceae bacterium]MBR5159689.1 hypothetical protein [Bacteroidaceae bacterium]
MLTMAIAPAIVAAIISGVSSLASTGIAAKNSKGQANTARDAYNRETEAQRRKIENWYNIRSNQDYTKRADVQAALTKQRELINERYNQSRATNVVAGGSEAALAAEKEAANKAMGETIANIAAAGAANQDKLDQMYLGMDNAASQNMANAGYNQNMQQAQQTAQAGAQASGAAVQMGGALVDALKDKEWSDLFKKKN